MANRKLIELLIEEGQDAFGVEAISLVKFPAIEENFIFFSKDKKQKALSLAAIDEEKRTLIGAALIPDKNIPRYDELSDEEYDVFFSQDTVKLASELFLKSNRTNEHTFEHQEKVDGVSVVESWIVEDPDMDKSKHYGMSMPVGTWMVRVHVGNDEMWEAVKEGSIRGFSIEGYFVDSVQDMSTKVKRASMNSVVKKIWGFFKRNFYAEINLQNGGVIATDDEALITGSKVFTLDAEGLPIELDNGKYKTEAGVDLEVFEGVLIEYDGEVQAVEDKVEEEVEMEKVELDTMKVSYYKALLKGRIQTYLGIQSKSRILRETKKEMNYKFNIEEQAIRELESLGIDVMDSTNPRALFMMAVGDSDHASYWSSSDFAILGSEELQDIMNAYGMWWEWKDDVFANVYSND